MSSQQSVRRFMIRRPPGDAWRKWYPWVVYDQDLHTGEFFGDHASALQHVAGRLAAEERAGCDR
ncbi:hypothetical protein B0T42_12600 [Rathayibacter sp. VKM Ac-2630]|nr:hypothetical protein B0T42_12600 [Rathayibacter sp. VKM Ac-2630]